MPKKGRAPVVNQPLGTKSRDSRKKEDGCSSHDVLQPVGCYYTAAILLLLLLMFAASFAVTIAFTK